MLSSGLGLGWACSAREGHPRAVGSVPPSRRLLAGLPECPVADLGGGWGGERAGGLGSKELGGPEGRLMAPGFSPPRSAAAAAALQDPTPPPSQGMCDFAPGRSRTLPPGEDDSEPRGHQQGLWRLGVQRRRGRAGQAAAEPQRGGAPACHHLHAGCRLHCRERRAWRRAAQLPRSLPDGRRSGSWNRHADGEGFFLVLLAQSECYGLGWALWERLLFLGAATAPQERLALGEGALVGPSLSWSGRPCRLPGGPATIGPSGCPPVAKPGEQSTPHLGPAKSQCWPRAFRCLPLLGRAYCQPECS